MTEHEWYGTHDVTDPGDADPHLATILRFPIKSLDAERRDRATLVADGALSGDRRWAIVDRPPEEPFDPASADVGGTGDYVNGKRPIRSIGSDRSTTRGRRLALPSPCENRQRHPRTNAGSNSTTAVRDWPKPTYTPT